MFADNFKEYPVDWSENGGINAVDHKDYLDLLEKDFYERVTRLVDVAVERQDQSIKVGFYFIMIYSTLERDVLNVSAVSDTSRLDFISFVLYLTVSLKIKIICFFTGSL